MTHQEYLFSLIGIGRSKEEGGGGGTPAVIEPLSVTENGTYTAPAGMDGYNPVTVAVPEPSGTINITENGTFSVVDKAQAVVNVQGSTGQDKSVALIEGTATEYESSEVTTVRNNAFMNMSSLQRVSLPNAESVGGNSFYLSGVTSLNLPKVASAGAGAFKDIKAETIELPMLSQGTGANIFCNSYAASGAPYLKSVKLPKWYGVLTTIATPATFYGQDALETVDIGTAGITSNLTIGAQDFSGCSKLTALIIRWDKVATLRNVNALNGTAIRSGTGYIYVPSALVSQYQAATNWSTYSARFRALEDYTVDGTASGELDPNKI